MTRGIRLALVPVLAVCALSALACNSKKPEKVGPVLASIGDDVITADDFKRRLDETSPFLRARYNTPERKKEFLENLIKNELLAQEAQRRGLEKTPAVQEIVKRAMVQELLRQQLDEKLAGGDLADGDLRKFYEGHVDDYVKPEKIRINHLLVAASPDNQIARREARTRSCERDGASTRTRWPCAPEVPLTPSSLETVPAPCPCASYHLAMNL